MVEVGLLPEALLILFVVIAESYWSEARDYYFKSMSEDITTKKSNLFYNNSKKAREVFALCNVGMLLALIAIFSRIFKQKWQILDLVSIISISISAIILLGFLFAMISQKYYLSYPDPRDNSD